MKQIGDRDVKEKALFHFVLYPLEERGVGVRWAGRQTEGQGGMVITPVLTHGQGGLWMVGAGREQVPSCGWETFPVSLPGGSLIIIYRHRQPGGQPGSSMVLGPEPSLAARELYSRTSHATLL